MRGVGIKETKPIQVKGIKNSVSENVSLRRRIEVLEKSLFELREKVCPLESEIRKVREYIGMSG